MGEKGDGHEVAGRALAGPFRSRTSQPREAQEGVPELSPELAALRLMRGRLQPRPR